MKLRFNRVISNLTWTTLGEIIGLVIGLFIAIMLARYLGPEDYGKYSVIISFGVVFFVVANFGIDPLTIKNVSRNRSLSVEYIGFHLIIKPSGSILCVISLNIMSFALGYPKEILICIGIYSIHILFNTLTESACSISKAYERMGYSSLVKVVNSFVGLTLIVVLVAVNGMLIQIVGAPLG